MLFSQAITGSKPKTFHQHDGYLVGQLLVATPLVTEDTFNRSVVYVFAHDEEGAMGVVINRPLPGIDFSSLFEQLDINVTEHNQHVPVYHGGPVELARGFVLYDSEYPCAEAISIENGIGVTASAGILRDIAQGRGPKKSLIAVGYAGWSAGQLEAEIEQNGWLTVPATHELLFDLPSDVKWATASASLGIDMGFYSTAAGHA